MHKKSFKELQCMSALYLTDCGGLLAETKFKSSDLECFEAATGPSKLLLCQIRTLTKFIPSLLLS